jgi:hypothetical protein
MLLNLDMMRFGIQLGHTDHREKSIAAASYKPLSLN